MVIEKNLPLVTYSPNRIHDAPIKEAKPSKNPKKNQTLADLTPKHPSV
jgi:hypothetical protein